MVAGVAGGVLLPCRGERHPRLTGDLAAAIAGGHDPVPPGKAGPAHFGRCHV